MHAKSKFIFVLVSWLGNAKKTDSLASTRAVTAYVSVVVQIMATRVVKIALIAAMS